VIEGLAALTARGIAVHFQPGNRDFLVGERFLRATGAIELGDVEVIELGGRRTVLCHGDTLCTGDTAYQAFRAQVRDPAWQREFLARPLADRRALAAGLREDSGSAMNGKTAAEMDVDPGALRALCRDETAERVIHGHTHRPGHDRWVVDERTVERWVLADWFQHGSFLRALDGTITTEPLATAPGP
jgi:UDP-2,3-diacylglucosamine hydrolase